MSFSLWACHSISAEMPRDARGNPSYQACFKKFTLFKFGREEVSETDLLSVTDEDVVRFLKLQVYGNEAPSCWARPILGRANTIQSFKKMLSAFMPRRNMVWDGVEKRGNPTRYMALLRLTFFH